MCTIQLVFQDGITSPKLGNNYELKQSAVIEDKPIKCFKVRHNDDYTYRIEIIYDDDSSTVVFDTPSDKAEHTYEVPENHRIIGVYGYDYCRFFSWILTTDF